MAGGTSLISLPANEEFNAFQEETDGQKESVGPYTNYERGQNTMDVRTYKLAAECHSIVT